MKQMVYLRVAVEVETDGGLRVVPEMAEYGITDPQTLAYKIAVARLHGSTHVDGLTGAEELSIRNVHIVDLEWDHEAPAH